MSDLSLQELSRLKTWLFVFWLLCLIFLPFLLARYVFQFGSFTFALGVFILASGFLIALLVIALLLKSTSKFVLFLFFWILCFSAIPFLVFLLVQQVSSILWAVVVAGLMAGFLLVVLFTVDIIRFVRRIERYCPGCKRWRALEFTEYVTTKPNGAIVKIYHCIYCGYEKRYRINYPFRI